MSDLLGKGGLREVVGEIYWDPSTTQVRHDLDLVVLLCQNGRVPDASYIINGNTPYDPEHPVQHTGDDQTGESSTSGDGVGDEQVQCKLTNLEPGIDKVAFAVVSNGEDISFDVVQGAFFRMFDPEAQQELYRRDLTATGILETALAVGEVLLSNGKWNFQEISIGSSQGINGIAEYYGFQPEV